MERRDFSGNEQQVSGITEAFFTYGQCEFSQLQPSNWCQANRLRDGMITGEMFDQWDDKKCKVFFIISYGCFQK